MASSIDNKKDENSSENGTPNIKAFFINYLSSIFFTILFLIFIIGGLGLYTTKVAQANILPDNIDLAPYTIIDRVVTPITIDMNVMRPGVLSETSECLSQKAQFNSKEYLDSFNNGLLCFFKRNATPTMGVFANAALFFAKVYENIIAKNFFVINQCFFSLSNLPEWLIMLVYGTLGIFFFGILWFITTCLSILYHVINIPELFRSPSIEDEGIWESNENVSFIHPLKLIAFFCIWFPVGLISTFVSPFFLTLYALISPLYASYKIKQTNNISGEKKSYNVFDFLKDTLVYKRFYFLILSTISLLVNGQTYLGSKAAVGVTIAVIILWFIGLYTNTMPSVGQDGFSLKIQSRSKQATINKDLKKLVKICQIPIVNKETNELMKKGEIRKVTIPETNNSVEKSIEMKTFNSNKNPVDNSVNNSVVEEPVVENPNNSVVENSSKIPETNSSVENSVVEKPNINPHDTMTPYKHNQDSIMDTNVNTI